MAESESKKQLIQYLLESQSVQVNTESPFTYPSGLRSPIFCDYRMLLGHVDAREFINKEFLKIIDPLECDIIAGTATAAIAWAAFIAQNLKKPMSYIRVVKKDHGAGKLIEGASVKGKTVLLFEDVIATGLSVLKACDILKEAGAKSVKVLTIYDYEFAEVPKRFKEAHVEYGNLTNFTTLMDLGKQLHYFTDKEIEMVKDWIEEPEGWYSKHY